MLDTLRNAAGTWVAKLLLLLLVLSFAVWGISGSLMNPAGGAVVATGETTVSVNEFRLAYDRQVSVLSQQFGQRITREQATQFGIDQQVTAQLVAGAVLDEQARRLGLGLSRDKLAQLTAEDPAFRGTNGQFDRMQFDFVLRQVGMRPEDYLRNREQVAIRQQIVEAVSDGMKAPDTFLRAVSLYQGESRTVDYVTLPATAAGAVAAPADDVLRTWFDENKATYAAPEYRKIAYVKLEPSDIADPTSITDDQVAKDYEANKKRFTTPETRAIEQLVFPTEDAAKLALESMRGGSTFDAIVTAQGKTLEDVKLGTFTREQVADPAVAEAAFALGDNEVSPIVNGAFGPVIVRVTEINPEVVKTLAEVGEQIRQDMAITEANSQLLDVHDRYEDARAGGETLEEAAAKLKLQVVTVEAVDRSGQTPDGTVVSTLPASTKLLAEAFATEPNVENPAINIGSSGFVFYEVKATIPARERTLDEVRAKVVADWTAAETERLLSTKAAELQKRLKDGDDFAAIAAELGLEKQTKRGLKRGADDPDLGAAGVAAVFASAPGAAGVAATPAGDARNLFKVIEVLEPVGAGADALPAESQASFASGMADDLLDQLVARLQTEFGVTTNQAAIQQALSF
ncbi:MAG: SurA N-terminal domain-containing protein [Mesorhizobium sp.]|nr:SurA N-terminal domain-containing protein [Mesorhizobium sp.]